jgi:hypothetical protein
VSGTRFKVILIARWSFMDEGYLFSQNSLEIGHIYIWKEAPIRSKLSELHIYVIALGVTMPGMAMSHVCTSRERRCLRIPVTNRGLRTRCSSRESPHPLWYSYSVADSAEGRQEVPAGASRQPDTHGHHQNLAPSQYGPSPSKPLARPEPSMA